jgi:hypothetical protein
MNYLEDKSKICELKLLSNVKIERLSDKGLKLAGLEWGNFFKACPRHFYSGAEIFKRTHNKSYRLPPTTVLGAMNGIP